MSLSLYDPRRRRVGDVPALLNRPGWIVPRLTIWPDEELGSCNCPSQPEENCRLTPEECHERRHTFVRVSTMIPADGSEGYLAREVSNSIAACEIPAIISQFRNDPEGFLETFFNLRLGADRVGSRTSRLPAVAEVGI